MNTAATPVTPEKTSTSTDSQPRGIGGWLLLPLLGLVMSIVLIARNLLELNQLRVSAEWLARTGPGSATPSELWNPYLGMSLAVGAVLILFAAVLLVGFVLRRRWLRAGVIGFYLALIVAAGLDVGMLSLLPGGGFTPDSLRGAWTQLVRAIVSGAVWSLYFLVSKRVRNTFVR
jgi:hypothetical protein